jgi:hypothetical protein
MTAHEAIEWLQAILDDTLDPDDEVDAQRIEAVELAIDTLQKEEAAPASK